jgi:periplasmic protein TonB
MHFSNMNDGGGSKATKIAVVAAVHVVLGTALVHSINNHTITMPKPPEDLMVMIHPEMPKPPPPPPEPPKPMPKVAPPEIVAPKVEVQTPPPQDPPPVQATTEPSPEPAQPNAQVQADAPPAQPSENTGAMRTAVLADANGCAKPAYPTNAMRNGDTGTVTLALLVGTDGRVTSSRIEHSSGHRELDKAAVNALSLCKFKPGMNNGAPEAGWAQLAYVWKLDD